MAFRKLNIDELQTLTPQEFIHTNKLPVTVVLDNVRSFHNVGAVFRIADAFRLEALYLCGITGVPPSSEIHKTALGAEDTVTWKYFNDTVQAIKELQDKHYIVAAVEQATGSVSLENITVENDIHYAVVFGHEVKGISQELLNICNVCIQIPQFGTKHSLNVSVTAGIVLWEFTKKIITHSALPAIPRVP